MQRPLNQCYGGIPYIVHPKDTLGSISKMFNIPLKEILDSNPTIYNQDLLFIGQVLCIPTGACPPGSNYYNVRLGDTFYSISKRYNIPIEELFKLNPNVNPNKMYIGQTLCLPSTERYSSYYK